MRFLLGLFLPGMRTYTLSVLAFIFAIILQADFQGIIELMPMMKLGLGMALAAILPLLPIFIRKAITNEAKKRR